MSRIFFPFSELICGLIRCHFQSLRHSVSMSMPRMLKGPFLQGINDRKAELMSKSSNVWPGVLPMLTVSDWKSTLRPSLVGRDAMISSHSCRRPCFFKVERQALRSAWCASRNESIVALKNLSILSIGMTAMHGSCDQ